MYCIGCGNVLYWVRFSTVGCGNVLYPAVPELALQYTISRNSYEEAAKEFTRKFARPPEQLPGSIFIEGADGMLVKYDDIRADMTIKGLKQRIQAKVQIFKTTKLRGRFFFCNCAYYYFPQRPSF